MPKKVRVGIIGGFGRIGKEVRERVIEQGWQVPAVVEISGVYDGRESKVDELSNWLVCLIATDVVALCIPTLDDGRTALEYILPLVKKGIPVVTSEKGALANYYSELSPWLDRIGYSATVGGGTRMLHWLKERISPRTEKVLLIINGTLNFIWDGLSKGRTLEEMVREAIESGYVEPGAQGMLGVVNEEVCKDIPMKTSVVLNVCGLAKVRAAQITSSEITESDLRRLTTDEVSRRFVVLITRQKDEDDIIGGFKLDLRNGWYVSAGFKEVRGPLLSRFIPPGVNNTALVAGPEGRYILAGPGAGPSYTVLGSMMKDIEDFLKLH